ncbi:ion transporter [Halostella sp. JP-L12]|uniref:pentapeptide repeat-containing protein n=1 Tax=Halostella TaxID=1843185 RepID=UPI000EF7C31F|nr:MULTISPECIES: pentapeptide repeat-containing protein [Halostella]NHN46890.1 ion transporter [Halostella sp. JP-L12]
MADAQGDQCDYRLEIGLIDDDFSSDPCSRPTWEDHDRCVWHAKVDGKTKETIEEVQEGSAVDVDGAYLREAALGGVDWFANSSIIGADLTGADLRGADFSGADMMLTNLTNVSAINTDFSEANLEGAIFTNADLRRATLQKALLNDAVLTDVHIGGSTDLGAVSPYDQESVEPKLSDVHRLEAAAWAYRQLEQLYQDNALPRLAQRSYNQEKDARRRLAWHQGDYAEAIKWSASKWAMKYGSSPYRILVVSLIVITASALLYPLTGGIREVGNGGSITYSIENPQEAPAWWIARVMFKSFYFSVVTFATLGYGDIQPIGFLARMLAGVETILGTLLAALLVFVLARIVTW